MLHTQAAVNQENLWLKTPLFIQCHCYSNQNDRFLDNIKSDQFGPKRVMFTQKAIFYTLGLLRIVAVAEQNFQNKNFNVGFLWSGL